MKPWKLCYVKEPWAYFTTLELDQQWGDDWDDAPYEHNAGVPYDDKGSILKVAFDGSWDTPCSNECNSKFSVKGINAGAVAWLRTAFHYKDDPYIVVPAGCPLDEFKRLISLGGGSVYEVSR